MDAVVTDRGDGVEIRGDRLTLGPAGISIGQTSVEVEIAKRFPPNESDGLPETTTINRPCRIILEFLD